MTIFNKVIKAVRRILTGRKAVRRISDLVVHGKGWYISNGEYCEVR